MEKIKAIPDFDGYYVSTEGKIYSTLGRGRRNKAKRVEPYELKPRPGKKGYMRVYMRQNSTNKRVDRYIHILVAQAFIPYPEDGQKYEVNHKDFDRSNNCVSNLEWLTQKENLAYSFNAKRLKRDTKTGRFYS